MILHNIKICVYISENELRRVKLKLARLYIIHKSSVSLFAQLLYPTPSWSCYGGILVSLHLSVCPFVCPSFRPASRVRSVGPTVLVGFIHIYTSDQATSENVSHVKFLAKFWNLNVWQFFSICNFDFVVFWHGIWCESLVWVIMGWRVVSQNAGILVVLVPARSDLNMKDLPKAKWQYLLHRNYFPNKDNLNKHCDWDMD